ncbi:MAG TPA: helix-hairpin-helix domain-containing protein [Desulfotignum sp.]|nr:helix-hairpin-helix domain-containing protein [Desulfotignum sp.]
MQKVKMMVKIALIGLLVIGFLVPVVSGAGKVNINTDGKEQLMSLKNIGDVVADRIIAHRKVHPFAAPEDFMKVKGVGVKTFEANKDRIIIKNE